MTNSTILSRADMARLAELDREAGRTIVFTNGCFDILHVGHVTYLHEARQLGDVLFVGVNSDESAHSLKGDGRPYNSAVDRATVLATLRDVSGVTIFDEPTATELVEAVRPDIYVKGGDYPSDRSAPSYPPEALVVAAYGGTVRIIPFKDGYSTTRLIQRIQATS